MNCSVGIILNYESLAFKRTQMRRFKTSGERFERTSGVHHFQLCFKSAFVLHENCTLS